MPEPLLSAARYVIRDKKAPAASALTDALAAAGAVVHCGFDCLAPDGERLPATINTCAVVPSATGKGRSFKEFFKHFQEAQNARARRAAQEGDDNDLDDGSRGRCVETMVTRGISYRALVEMLAGYGKNLTLQREDGSSLLNTELFKKNTDALTQLWSGSPDLDWFVHRKALYAVEARGSLGFRIQPEPMYEYAKGPGLIDKKIGVWGRAVVGCHDPERYPDNNSYWIGPGQDSSNAFQDRMGKLAKEINDRRSSGDLERIKVKLDVHAIAFMEELSYRIGEWKESEYRDITEAIGRAWENTLRIAVVFQVFCVGGGAVSVDMVKRAWTIVEWSLSQYRLVFIDTATPPPTPSRTAMVRAQTLQPKPSRTHKPEQPPRPLQNAQWILTCLDRLVRPFQQRALLADVRVLAGLPDKQFDSALAWLKLEHVIATYETDQGTVISRSYTNVL